MHLDYLKLLFFSTLFSFFSCGAYTQDTDTANKDSLIAITKAQNTADTTRIDAFYHLARIVIYQNPDSAEYFVSKGMELSEEINDLNGMGEAYGWMGYLKAEKGDIAAALDYNLKSLNVAQKLNLKAEFPVILNNMANLHVDLGNNLQAQKYFLECVAINTELGNEASLATNYNNLGSFYRSEQDFEKALNYFNKALEIRLRLQDEYGLSYTYSNMGSVFEQQGEIDTALHYYQLGLEIRRRLTLNRGTATSLFKIGNIYLLQHQLNKAEAYTKEAFDLAERWDYTYEKKEAAKILYKIHKAKNETAKALAYFETYATLHDSINSLENQRAVLRGKYQFEYNQKHLIDSLENAKILIENKLLDEEVKVNEGRLSVQRLWLTISLLLMLILLIYFYFTKKNADVRMANLRAEIRLRLNETIRLKEELESSREDNSQPANDLNIVLEDKLTEREQEILDALALGLTNKEIGEKLFLSVNTIKTHILSLYTKLDVNNRTQAAIKGSLLKNQKNA